MTVRRKPLIPSRNLLTNKRDNESDLGGARFSDRLSAEDVPPPYPAIRNDNRKSDPR